MTTTRVRAHERVREGKHEHVKEHSRRVQGGTGGAEEPNPEDYEGILEKEQGEENAIPEKKSENIKQGSSNDPQTNSAKSEDKKGDRR